MFALTFAQMRRSIGRLAAAGVAIAIGTAFVAATLLASDVLKRASYDSIAAQYGQAELVVRGASTFGDSDSFTADQDQLEQMRQIDGVAAADPVETTYVELHNGARSLYQATIAVPSSPKLQPLTLTSGAFPASSTEIALPADAAKLLGVSVGDTLTEVAWAPAAADVVPDVDGEAATTTPEADGPVETTLTVTGIVDDPYKAYAMQGGAAVVTADTFADRRWVDVEPTFRDIAVLLEPGADQSAVQSQLDDVVAGEDMVVTTKDAAAESSINSVTGGQQVFTLTILSFAAIALLVAALVISNTFQVIVAQRTRTLALLRCVGAKKSQLRQSVVLEAATLGLVSSAIGLAVGSAFVQIAVMVLGRVDLDIPVPGRISFSVAAVVWPLVVGTLVTVLASLVPARAATRVAPLEALRPSEAPSATAGGGRVRLVFTLLLVLGGALLMVGGVAASQNGQVEVGLLAGVLGGATSFVGVLLGAVFWVPKIVGAVGRMLSSAGPSTQLAAANITRNPRRTAATSSALLIGVTLVAMMSVGASTARGSLSSTLDGTYNVDVQVQGQAWSAGTDVEPLSPTLISEVSSLDGIDAVAPITEVLVRTESNGSVAEDETVQVVDPASARGALRDPSILDGLDATHAVVSKNYADYFLQGSSTITLEGDRGEVTLDAVVGDISGMNVVVDSSVGEQIVSSTAPTSVWVKVTDLDDAGSTVNEIRDAVSGTSVGVAGAAVERATMQQAIDTILAVVVGLLAIAVVIALIGVANTLSLSVLERRRESATLRAIGLSKRQLRSTLAQEGMLIAGVGAVLGVALGLLYGWVGSLVVLGSFADVSLTVPFGTLGLVVLVAVAAGLLASIVPGRSAAKTSPVEALAVD
jgi:putative ABC transport system permease protein